MCPQPIWLVFTMWKTSKASVIFFSIELSKFWTHQIDPFQKHAFLFWGFVSGALTFSQRLKLKTRNVLRRGQSLGKHFGQLFLLFLRHSQSTSTLSMKPFHSALYSREASLTKTRISQIQISLWKLFYWPAGLVLLYQLETTQYKNWLWGDFFYQKTFGVRQTCSS